MEKITRCLLLLAFLLIANTGFGKCPECGSPMLPSAGGMSCSDQKCREKTDKIKDFIEAIQKALSTTIQHPQVKPETKEAIGYVYLAAKSYQEGSKELNIKDQNEIRGILGLQWQKNFNENAWKSTHPDAKPMMPVAAVEPMVQIARAAGLKSQLSVNWMKTAIWAAHIWLAVQEPGASPTFEQNPQLLMAAFLFFLAAEMNDQENITEELKIALSWLHQFVGRHMNYGIINKPLHYPQAQDEEPLSDEEVKRRRALFDQASESFKPVTQLDNATPDDSVAVDLEDIFQGQPEKLVASMVFTGSYTGRSLEKVAFIRFQQDGQVYYRLILLVSQMILTVAEKELGNAMRAIRENIQESARQTDCIRTRRNRLLNGAELSGVGCYTAACAAPLFEYFAYGRISRETVVANGIMLAVLVVLLETTRSMWL